MKVVGKGFWLVSVSIVTFLLVNTNCMARVLTFDEINEEFFSSPAIEEVVGSSTDTFNLENNSSAGTWDVYRNEERLFSFVYNQDNISYEAPSQEESLNSLAGIWIVGMIQTIFNLSGVDAEGLSEDNLTSANYEDSGLSIVIENYSSVGSENGSSWDIDVDYVTNFRMSLDTDVISNYFSNISEEVNEDSNVTDNNNNNNNNQDQIENPDTGAFGLKGILIVLLISSVFLIIYANKKSKLKRI